MVRKLIGSNKTGPERSCDYKYKGPSTCYKNKDICFRLWSPNHPKSCSRLCCPEIQTSLFLLINTQETANSLTVISVTLFFSTKIVYWILFLQSHPKLKSKNYLLLLLISYPKSLSPAHSSIWISINLSSPFNSINLFQFLSP